MKKAIKIEVEMYCSSVSESIVEDRINEILKGIKSQAERFKYDNHSNLLNDYLSTDPYEEHKADLFINIKETNED
jgi:hypothetical protein